jgi:hypothetical protein
LARTTTEGVDSVVSTSRSAKTVLRTCSAQAAKVVTATPVTSSEGNTRDT